MFTCLKCVEENYDIPRSHQLPYNNPKQPLSASTHLNLGTGLVATSTPNLSADIPPRSSKDARHFYTNAAPTNLEGNVFRYDFDEQVRSIFFISNTLPKIQRIVQRNMHLRSIVDSSRKSPPMTIKARTWLRYNPDATPPRHCRTKT